jgi:tRNA threonylcarbamoyladenosine biosynthesis protein TsaB
MSIILNIESATDVCSVGISENGQLSCREETKGPYQHASQITILIDRCLRNAGISLPALDAVAVSRGPGSYTSLRVGASAAKGICYGLGKPLIAVDTLESLARASANGGDDAAWLYCPMIDARRMEVYAAMYDASFRLIQEPRALIIDEDSFSNYFERGKTIVFSGNGASKCRAVLKNFRARFREVTCDAAFLTVLAQRAFDRKAFQDIAYYAPFYLKPPNITKPKKVL